jgi:hypothetical protein
MSFTGHRRHHVALGVDDHQRRPRLGGIRLPGDQIRVIENWMAHGVALDSGGERFGVGLMLELGRVNPNEDKGIGEPGLQRAQLIQDVQTVDAAERPEVEDHNTPAQIGQA